MNYCDGYVGMSLTLISHGRPRYVGRICTLIEKIEDDCGEQFFKVDFGEGGTLTLFPWRFESAMSKPESIISKIKQMSERFNSRKRAKC